MRPLPNPTRLKPKAAIDTWQQLTPLTQGLLILLVVNTLWVLPSALVALSDYFIFHLPLKARELPFYHLVQFFTLRQDLDSWEPMWSAFEQLKAEPRMPLYAEIFFEQHTKFQYPLTSMLLFYALQAVLSPFNPSYPQALYSVLAVLSWLSFAILLIVSVKIFNISERQTAAPSPGKFEQILRAVLLILLGLSFYPAIRAYSLGQIQAWINALFAVMLWCWMREQKQIAGILGGLICLVKPQYAVILLWGVLRRQWRFAVTFVSVTAAGWLVACGMFGIANNLDYLKVLSFISKRGEAYYPNQSVNGLMNRLLFNGSNLTWTADSFAPFNGWIYGCTLASSVLLLLFALRPPVKRSQGTALDFALVSLTATMASPIAWEHHYGILLPIYAVILPQLFQHRVWNALSLPLLALSYVLASHYFYIAKKLADTPILNLAQSYLFFGALIVLLSLYRLRDQVSTPLLSPSESSLAPELS
ncbi:MAG: glycosyltransferase family 87 protein [Phormidesmis sp.]